MTKNNISPEGRDMYGVSEDGNYFSLFFTKEGFCLPPMGAQTSIEYSGILLWFKY